MRAGGRFGPPAPTPAGDSRSGGVGRRARGFAPRLLVALVALDDLLDAAGGHAGGVGDVAAGDAGGARGDDGLVALMGERLEREDVVVEHYVPAAIMGGAHDREEIAIFEIKTRTAAAAGAASTGGPTSSGTTRS